MERVLICRSATDPILRNNGRNLLRRIYLPKRGHEVVGVLYRPMCPFMGTPDSGGSRPGKVPLGTPFPADMEARGPGGVSH